MSTLRTLLLVGCYVASGAVSACAQENPAKLSLAGGKLELTAPGTWVRQQPRTRIVEHEFAIPPSEGDKADGRLTVMSAGGGVEANIDRWYGQFTQPDGGSTKEHAKVKKIEVAGHEVYLVDIAGTFKDQRGPVAPIVERPKYRMLGAIIPSKAGDQYIKFYGPQRTVADNEPAFVKMIEGMQQK